MQVAGFERFDEEVGLALVGAEIVRSVPIRQSWIFEAPDLARFPCLGFAYRALRAGGAASAVLNAANEVAVEAFLERRLPFIRIAPTIEQVLDEYQPEPAATVDDLLEIDSLARECAARAVAEHA